MDGVKSVIIPGESVIFFIPSPCPFPLPVQRLSIFSILGPERAKKLSIGVHGFAENRENRQPLKGREPVKEGELASRLRSLRCAQPSAARQIRSDEPCGKQKLTNSENVRVPNGALVSLFPMDEWGFNRELSVLASRVAKRLGDSAAASSALKLVRERAPDERLALAFLLKLVEQSATSLRAVLADPARAADLVFCLGASELVATGLCAIDPLAWPEFFESARTSTADALIETLRFDLHEAADRQE